MANSIKQYDNYFYQAFGHGIKQSGLRVGDFVTSCTEYPDSRSHRFRATVDAYGQRYAAEFEVNDTILYAASFLDVINEVAKKSVLAIKREMTKSPYYIAPVTEVKVDAEPTISFGALSNAKDAKRFAQQKLQSDGTINFGSVGIEDWVIIAASLKGKIDRPSDEKKSPEKSEWEKFMNQIEKDI